MIINDCDWPDTVLQKFYRNPPLRICSSCCASAPGAALQGSELMDWDFSVWHHYRSMIINTVSVSELVDWDLSILHHSRSLMIHSKLIPAQNISVDWLRLSIWQHSLSINDHPQQTDPQVPECSEGEHDRDVTHVARVLRRVLFVFLVAFLLGLIK